MLADLPAACLTRAAPPASYAVQDQALLEIEAGIGNLKQYGTAIGDEAKHHTDILGSVDMDVQEATSQLHHEAKRAITVQKYDDNWKLVVAILVLSGILFVLVEFSPHPLRNQTPGMMAPGLVVRHHQGYRTGGP